MKDWQRENLNKNLEEILHCLNFNIALIKLRSREIFDRHEDQLVRNEKVNPTDQAKRLKIIDTLLTKNDDGYWALCHIIKDDSPYLYLLLHNDEAETCPECIEECKSENCSRCSKLLKMLSTAENRVLIEKPEDILQVVCSWKCEVQALKNEKVRLENENARLYADNENYFYRSIRTTEVQKALENSCTELSKELEASQREKGDIEVKNEELQQIIADLKVQNERLNSSLGKYKNDMEKLEEDPHYLNRDTIIKHQIEYLSVCLEQSKQEAQTFKEQSNKLKLEASRLKNRNQTVEEVLHNQRLHSNRSVAELNAKCEEIQKDKTKLKAECESLTNHLGVVKKEKNDTMDERDHILAKLYEKNDKLKEVQQELSNANTKLESSEKIEKYYSDRIEALKSVNETLNAQFRTVVDERDRVMEENKELMRARDRFSIRCLDLQEMKGEELFIGKEYQEQLQKIQEESNSLRRKYDILTKLAPREYEVILRKNNNSDIFGVNFGVRCGPIFLGESKIFISKVNGNADSAPLADIKVGDSVIRINDYNVQEYDRNGLGSIYDQGQNTMKLVLRSAARKVSVKANLDLQRTNQDLGIQIGLFVINSDDNKTGLRNFDEIVEICTSDGSVTNIKQKIKNKILDRYFYELIRKTNVRLTVSRYDWNSVIKRTWINGNERKTSARSSLKSTASSTDSFETLQGTPYEFESEGRKNSRSTSRSSSMHSNGTVSNLGMEPISQESRKLPEERSFYSSCSGAKNSQTSQETVKKKQSLNSSTSTISRQSRLTVRDESYDCGDYSYVSSHQFLITDQLRSDQLQITDQLRSDQLQKADDIGNHTITVKKEATEKFGFTVEGGNMTGIFVKAVSEGGPADKCGMKKGYQILSINSFSVVGVAKCYAMDVLTRVNRTTKETFFEVVPVPVERYEEIMNKPHFDNFRVRTIKGFKAQNETEMSFLAGEVLVITNSYYLVADGPYKWKALREDGQTGVIPRQISSQSNTAIEEHVYEDIYRSTTSLSIDTDDGRFDQYYELLDKIGDVLVFT